MALKFLNKKGWHTGSLRNIENVWKAEQKHEAEQRKLEELRKQIHEERDRAEFRQLQEQAGLISGQERLEFLYDSGLAVGKSSGFKALESVPTVEPNAAASSSTSAKPQSAAPGALFEEDKPQSANDAWRKLTFDPLLSIRRSEQESLARIKNNPIQMDMIRKSVEAKKNNSKDEKKHRKRHHSKKSKRKSNSSSENDSEDTSTVEKHREDRRKSSRSEKRSTKRTHTFYNETEKHPTKRTHASYDETSEGDTRRKKYYDEYKDRRTSGRFDDQYRSEKINHDTREKEYSSERQLESRHEKRSYPSSSVKPPRPGSNNRHRNTVKLTEEERAAKLKEMEMDAQRHEEQRWKRLKKAAEVDAQEAIKDHASSGRNFLDATQKSVYGAEKGGSSTIEESVRRRTHYSQRQSDSESNAFRRA